jgi:hypothetical protein
MINFFLFDAFIRFTIALLIIPLIIFTYSKYSRFILKIRPGRHTFIEQLMYVVYMLLLVFLTDDLFFKFSYLKNEFNRILHTNDDPFDIIFLGL